MIIGTDDLRTQRFNDWQSAYPDIDARLETLRTETALLAAQRSREQCVARSRAVADSLAVSSGLSDAERSRIADRLKDAELQSRAHDSVAASATYMEILAVDPANADAHFSLGVIRNKQGDVPGAARHLALAASFPRIGSNNGYFRSMMALQAMPAAVDPALNDPTIIFRVANAPTEVWDDVRAPKMTVIPGGEYRMGSMETEPNRSPAETPHRVTLAYPLGISTCDVTRAEFAAFVTATGYDAESSGGVQVFRNGRFTVDPEASWRNPGFDQRDDEPVVCVNFYDGLAYTKWLSEITGQTYRLPSEAEWEYAVRGGTSSSYYWGESLGLGNAHCDGCNLGQPLHRTLIGAQFPANPFGLFDVVGNVWKWLADVWNPNYVGSPDDGSAWEDGTTVLRGRRGGSWFNVSEARPGDVRAPNRLRSAARFGSLPELRFSSFGLRVAREI